MPRPIESKRLARRLNAWLGPIDRSIESHPPHAESPCSEFLLAKGIDRRTQSKGRQLPWQHTNCERQKRNSGPDQSINQITKRLRLFILFYYLQTHKTTQPNSTQPLCCLAHHPPQIDFFFFSLFR